MMTLPDPNFRDEDVTYDDDPYGRPLRVATVLIGGHPHCHAAETEASALAGLRSQLELPGVRMAIWAGHRLEKKR